MRRPIGRPPPSPPVETHATPDTLATVRADPVPERRLWRLQLLVRALPQDDRATHWDEALALARGADDSGRLLLIGFARHLPLPLATTATEELAAEVRDMHDPAKRALAWLALNEVAPLDAEVMADAWVHVQRIPHETLRIMVFTQLARRVR